MTATAKLSATATGAGLGFQIFGDLAGMTVTGWVIISLAVFLSVGSGALAWQGHYETYLAEDDIQIRKSRRHAVMVLAAQIMGGFLIASASGGNVWIIIAGGLPLGWTGTRFLDKLAKMGAGK